MGEIVNAKASAARLVSLSLSLATDAEVEAVAAIWSQFQEAPTLLDPWLADIIRPLASALRAGLDGGDSARVKRAAAAIYAATRARGHKAVARMLGHEAADVEVALDVLMADGEGERCVAASKSNREWGSDPI